ncbi:MAG: hypothetical protein RBR32_12075 [Bacteroidales bacterium]|nr:hypothetical protein [Bacteroidales bacterium]
MMDNNLDSKFSKCSIDSCENDAYEGHNECVLHCPKNSYGQDWTTGLAIDFYNEFKNYIIDFFKKYSSSIDGKITMEEMKAYLDSRNYNDLEYNNIFKDSYFVPTFIIFPDRDSRDHFDYLKILNLFGEIHFNYCQFYAKYLDLKDTKVFFQNCIFHTNWNLINYKILDNVNNVVYQNCTFNDNVFNDSTGSNKPYILNANQFDVYCTFNKDINLYNVHIDGLLFNIDKSSYIVEAKIADIDVLKIENVVFKNRFIIHGTSVKNLIIKNTIFEEKLELVESKVGHLEIYNANFRKIADFFDTKFIKFSITKSIFDDFVGFEQCEFGQDKNKKNIAAFTHVTFIGFINFRNAKFLSGLDLSMTNLKEYPNFLNTNINERFTNRETFRIIKYSFLKLGNTIESNKFYAKELEKYKEELDSKNYSFFNQERLIYFLNKHISNFGQSYFRPIFLLIIVSIVHYCIIRCYEANMLYKICEPLNPYINLLVVHLNDVAKNITPFKLMMTEGIEFLSILFGVIYSILLWHIIVAVKAHTRKSD